ncbi:FAD-dependent oxidoreductase [Rhodoferax sp. OV413]|uniref:FAD-dependent oxidoreductase n=1 Tax=Rhodoferax sp. OV413 TaxID=1855285 RepID=UPI0025D11B27|nr:FAD-dependent oxidoreductase [Rhodoferax sp. OV413]
MKIAIVGAGVVGIATAYELSGQGNDVTVFEKNSAAGEAASFANAGIHSNSCTLPLSIAALRGNHLTRLIQATRSLSTAHWYSPVNLRWLWAYSGAGSTARGERCLQHGQQMARLGMEITDALISRGQWEVEQSAGQLIVLGGETDLERYSLALELLKASEQPFRVLDGAELQGLEPSLQGIDKLHKAIHIPGDRIMNCRQFALLAKQEAQKDGVEFHFDTEVLAIESQSGPLLRTARGDVLGFDQIIVCTEAPLPQDILRLRLNLPLARIDSYAVSVGIREPLNAPRSAVQDHASGITISRIGKRLRACGGAELNRPTNAAHDKRMIGKLFRTLDQRFPGAANYAGGTQVWRGSRTFTTDGLPVVGPSGLPGVWLNLAHGAYGWTLATASARLLSQQLGGKPTSVPCELISPLRFKG